MERHKLYRDLLDLLDHHALVATAIEISNADYEVRRGESIVDATKDHEYEIRVKLIEPTRAVQGDTDRDPMKEPKEKGVE